MDRKEAIEILKDEKIDQSQFVNMWEQASIRNEYKEYIDEGRATIEALDLAIEALKGDLHCPKCGTIVRDGRQYHDLVYRGETEKLQLFGETSTNSNKNSKDNLSFSKSVKLINPCNSLLKPDSDERKEQKSKLDCISRQQAIAYIDRIINSGLGKNKSLDYIRKYISALPPLTPTVKVQQADTLIIAAALWYFAQDSERNVSDRERAEELRKQVLAYGASMCQPVTPTERTGEWVSHELWDMPWFTCSECNYHGRSDFKFCPNCGAKMGGDTE